MIRISGGGYPAYKDRIPSSIADIQTHGNIDYFFVCVDAEEDDPDEKLNEIENIITEQRKGRRNITAKPAIFKTYPA